MTRRHALAALLTLLPLLATAQSYRASVRGLVRDSTNAFVPGVTVTARSTATGLVRVTLSGGDGAFVIPEVPAGEYVVTAELSGFVPATRKVVVSVGSAATADLTLAQASVTEVITITDERPLVDESRDVLGQVVDQRLVSDLPLNGRDFGKLVALVPGATVEASGVAGTEKGFGQFNVNGNRDRSNNYTLDGTDNNDPFFNNSALNQVGITGAPASILPIDAIEEFNLESHFAAEYGRNSGSVVNVLTKSGANQLHGGVFEFLRNDALDARNYFDPVTNPDGTPNAKSPFRNNQFGATLSGPLVKDKTFFFLAYEGIRTRVGSNFVYQVPTAADRAAARALALSTPLYDGTRLTSINPALDGILDLFPQSASRSLPATVTDTNDVDSFLGKIDHRFSDSEQLSVRYAHSQSDQNYPLGSLGGFGSGSRLGQFSQISPARVDVVSASLLSTLGPRKVNEVRVGYSRYKTSFTGADASFDPSTLGLDFGTGKTGLPEIDFGGAIENLGTTAFSVPRGRTSQSFQLLDNFTWVSGRHTVKFGGEYRHAAIESFNDNLERGLFTFSPSGLSEDPVIDVLANFYQGNSFVLANTGDTLRHTSNAGLAAFVQDDLRLRPNLTLNLGLRWEYFGPLGERDDLLSNLAPDGTLQPIVAGQAPYKKDWNNFGPRLSLAWTVRPSTTVRAGWGIYYDYVPQNLLIANYTNSAGIATNAVGPKPVLSLGFDQTAFNGQTAGAVLSPGAPPYSAFVTPQDFDTPHAQSWNVNVQQSLGNRAAIEVGYVGSAGRNLVRLRDANQPDAFGNRPNPDFAFLDVLQPTARSDYHALQTTLRLSGWHGLSGFASYTYGKSLDDASDGIDFNFASAALPQDSNDLAAERGPSTFDTRHRFTAALDYDVPDLGHLPAWIGKGWRLDAIATVQSGRPIPIVTSNDTSAFFNDAFNTQSNFHQRPNLVPGVDPILASWSPTTGYLNPYAFQQPADGAFGDLGRNQIFGPGYWNVDLSVAKDTHLSGRFVVEIRIEAFNVFNHPNFALPSGTITPGINADGSRNDSAGPAGLISQTPDVAQGNPGLGGGGPRVIQIGLRLRF